ncbi:MAG: ATP-binding protein [Bacillota bacterium]|nr:ATP-binding protein [Bacillota bacterium]
MSWLLQMDRKWIEDGLLKRRSNYSPVICFETTDPKRLQQLRTFIANDGELKRFEYLFVYDQWNGLYRLAPSAAGLAEEPYKRNVGSTALMQRLGEEGGALTQFKAVLKEVDGFLKKHKCLFIIQNVAEHREAETGLQAALRSWAIDPLLVSKGSMIFLVTAEVDRILDSFTRELTVIISVDASSKAEREQIITSTARELEVKLDDEQRAELVMATAGLNLHQMESILLEAYFTTKGFPLFTIKNLKSNLVKRSGVLEVKDPELGFQDIGGYQVIKEFIQKYVINVLRYAERAKRFALPLPRGILLFGPPGTGKSLFANALAREVNLPFINLVTENIYSKWLGESGQNLKNAITLAEKMSPAIVFIDEIDRFGKRGGSADSAGEETRRVFSQFLEWLGRTDRQSIIVGTTNVPEHLDEAFTRTGRFDYKIPFLYPGESARLEILMVHLGMRGGHRNRAPMSLSDEELGAFLLEDIVPVTRNFSGAELEELVIRAKRHAFDRAAAGLGPQDLIWAARTFRVDEQQRRETIETCLEQARKFTDDQSFLDNLEQEMGLELG